MQKIYVIGKLLDIVHVTIVPLAHKCAAGFYAQVFLSGHFSNSNGYKEGFRGSQISPNIINIKGTDELGSYLSLKCPQNVFTLMDIGHRTRVQILSDLLKQFYATMICMIPPTYETRKPNFAAQSHRP